MAGRRCEACGRAAPEEAVRCPECGALLHGSSGAVDMVIDLAEQIQEALGPNYEVRDRIGRGGYAIVYRVHDRRLERDLAVKGLIPEFAAVPEIAERFRREARTAARLSHPNIVPIYFVGAESQTPCFAMPLVNGESLGARIRREGQLALRVALSVAQDVAGALDFAHGAGVVHRDVKPDNILLEFASGRSLLMDFGIAKAVAQEAALTGSGVIVGTPYYMSPEQAAGDEDLDARSDVYSMGVVVYEMLAGEPPFAGNNAQAVIAQHLSGSVPPLSSRRGELPEAMEQAVARALAKDPAERYESAGAFVTELEQGQGGPSLRHSGGAGFTQQRVDDMRLFRTLSTAEAADDPVGAVREADDVATLTEATEGAVRVAEEAAGEADGSTLLRTLAALGARRNDPQPALRQLVQAAIRRLADRADVVETLASTWRVGGAREQAATEQALVTLLPWAAASLVKLARRDRSAELVHLADRVGALNEEGAEKLARDPSASVVQAFVTALRESVRPSAAIERWLTTAARHPNSDVRAAVAEVAASRGGPLAARIGRLVLPDRETTVRRAAIQALAASGQREILPELARTLETGEEALQVAAVEALARFPTPEVVRLLSRVLDRKRWWRKERGPVQRAAARVLATMPRELGEETLRGLRSDRDPALRMIAADALDGGDRAGTEG